MKRTLFIRVPANPEAHVQCLRSDAGAGEVSVSVSDLGDITLPESGTEVVVFAPAVVVSLAEVSIPAQKRAQLLKAVPYALEDELAENVEDLHFAVLPRRNEPTLVAVVRRDWLAPLLERLSEHDLKPTAVVPETLCLPWREGEWTLLAEDETSILRTGRNAGFALDNENLDPVLASLSGSAAGGTGAVLRIHDRRPAGHTPLPVPEGPEVINEAGEDPVVALLARGYLAERHINLLQGEFAAQPTWHRSWRQWRLAAGLAIAAVAVHLAGIALENRHLSYQRDTLDNSMVTIYRAAFPDAVRIINPATQMRNRLAELRQQGAAGTSGFMDLVALAGPTLAGDARIAIRLLRYREGRMEVDLDADTIERLETLQHRLMGANLGVELRSVRNEGGRYLGRLVIGAQSS